VYTVFYLKETKMSSFSFIKSEDRSVEQGPVWGLVPVEGGG
jgi:hypothetical protein